MREPSRYSTAAMPANCNLLMHEVNGHNQRTISKEVKCHGRGLHTGCDVQLSLRPAPPHTGVVIRRTDLSNFEIPARIEQVARVSYATTLMRLGVMVSTVEHLLSALCGCQIDNCYIDVDSLEIPIMDGSAAPFIELIEAAQVIDQGVARCCLRVLDRIEARDGNRWIAIEPADDFTIDSTIDFPHPMIGRQRFQYQASPINYIGQIAAARTFGFQREIEALRAAGLIRGGSLDNAIVLTETGMLNEEPLRFVDEFARHKILDILGDLALIGRPVLGRVVAERSGHALHAQLVSQLLKHTDSWELVEQPVAQPIPVAVY